VEEAGLFYTAYMNIRRGPTPQAKVTRGEVQLRLDILLCVGMKEVEERIVHPCAVENQAIQAGPGD
jgi:hypothetical protein